MCRLLCPPRFQKGTIAFALLTRQREGTITGPILSGLDFAIPTNPKLRCFHLWLLNAKNFTDGRIGLTRLPTARCTPELSTQTIH